MPAVAVVDAVLGGVASVVGIRSVTIIPFDVVVVKTSLVTDEVGVDVVDGVVVADVVSIISAHSGGFAKDDQLRSAVATSGTSCL